MLNNLIHFIFGDNGYSLSETKTVIGVVNEIEISTKERVLFQDDYLIVFGDKLILKLNATSSYLTIENKNVKEAELLIFKHFKKNKYKYKLILPLGISKSGTGIETDTINLSKIRIPIL